jgi:hypothetical protein
MKRILSIALAAALLSQAVVAFAQDSGEPSEKSVLDAARAKYRAGENAESDSRQAAEAPEESAAAVAADQRDDFPFTPVQVSFVPGVSLPFGVYDVTLSAGMIGGITRDVSGAAGSGVFNISRDLRGVQGAGIFNIAENVHGLQGAGLFNIARSVQGGQAAGLFNSAGDVKGVQIGVVNIARNIDGVQIGLINIAGNGVDSLGAAYEPATSYVYAYWQSGTPTLYTIAGLGAPCRDWDCDPAGAVASIGLGSRSCLLGMKIDVDLSAESAIGALPYKSFAWSGDWSAWEGWSDLRPYPSLRIAAGVPIGHHWQVFAGLKADIDVKALGDRVPEALKSGPGWRGSLFDEGFTVWPKWFFGLKM